MVTANRSKARVSRCDPAKRDALAALPSTLRECGEVAGQRLAGVLFDALSQAEELLFSNSAQALTHGECEVMLNAAEFARLHRERMVEDFLRHFEHRYVRACQFKPTVMTAFQIDFDASQLEVVQHDLLDDSLEPGMLAEAIQNASWVALNDLTNFFGILLDAESIKPNDMPLSPKLIEAAVSEAVREQLWRHDAKSHVIRSLRKFFPDRVGLIYRDLAIYLRPILSISVLPEALPASSSHEASFELMNDHSYAFSEEVSCVEEVVEKTTDTSILVPANEVIEYAMVAARGELVRRHLALETVMPTSQAVLVSPLLPEVPLEVPPEVMPEVPPEVPPEVAPVEAVVVENLLAAPPLPDRAEPAAFLETSQPFSQNTPPTRESPISKAQAALALAGLTCGTRIEFLELDGSSTPLKVTWISPHKSLYLMTNREKKRTLSMGIDDLAAALSEGNMRIVMPSKHPASASAYPRQQAKKSA